MTICAVCGKDSAWLGFFDIPVCSDLCNDIIAENHEEWCRDNGIET